LIISIDYDDTYTADKSLFDGFIRQAKDNHTVYFVTYRHARRKQGNTDIEETARSLGISIIYTAGRQKREAIQADIWIDDKPELIPTAESLRAEFGFRKPRRRH